MAPRYPSRLLSPGEFVVLVRNPHWWTIAKHFALAVVAGALSVIILATGVIGAPWNIVASCVILIPVIAGALAKFVTWYCTTYVITNERLVVRAGVLSRSGTEIPLDAINNVAFSQTLFERILGSGDLDIESAGTTGHAHYENVRDPEGMQTILYRLREVRTMELRGGGKGDTTPEEHIRFFREKGLISEREARASLAALARS